MAPSLMAQQPVYHPASHTFQPCTLMSYDPIADQVLAPILGAAGIVGGIDVLCGLKLLANVAVGNVVLAGEPQSSHSATP